MLPTKDLPHSGTPYSQETCQPTEHPTHGGLDPPRNTLLIVETTHSMEEDPKLN